MGSVAWSLAYLFIGASGIHNLDIQAPPQYPRVEIGDSESEAAGAVGKAGKAGKAGKTGKTGKTGKDRERQGNGKRQEEVAGIGGYRGQLSRATAH